MQIRGSSDAMTSWAKLNLITFCAIFNLTTQEVKWSDVYIGDWTWTHGSLEQFSEEFGGIGYKLKQAANGLVFRNSAAKRRIDFGGEVVNCMPWDRTLTPMEIASQPGWMASGWLTSRKLEVISISSDSMSDGDSMSSGVICLSDEELSDDVFDDEVVCEQNVGITSGGPIVLTHILRHLCIKDALNFAQSCKAVREVVNTASFWRARLLSDFNCKCEYNVPHDRRKEMLLETYKTLTMFQD